MNYYIFQSKRHSDFPVVENLSTENDVLVPSGYECSEVPTKIEVIESGKVWPDRLYSMANILLVSERLKKFLSNYSSTKQFVSKISVGDSGFDYYYFRPEKGLSFNWESHGFGRSKQWFSEIEKFPETDLFHDDLRGWIVSSNFLEDYHHRQFTGCRISEIMALKS